MRPLGFGRFSTQGVELGSESGSAEPPKPKALSLGSFPLTVTVTTMGYRSYKSPLNKAPLRTVTGRGNDPT